MYVFLSIMLCTILGYLLMLFGPIFGGLLAFGIIAGCLFRGLYLLNEIHKHLKHPASNEEKTNQGGEHLQSALVYKQFLKEKR